ncbi:N-6 DNA methylase [Pedococcus sp. 2YAF34]|uniref:N-6 DNA methylase n=1 Tax=Pedococcus sp. 2YAF34 TaxID=3233032 RepID=UPI003F97BD11
MSQAKQQDPQQVMRLIDTVRSIGRENGLDLLLSLTYLRGMSFRAESELEGWRRTVDDLLSHGRPDEWLDRYLMDATNGLWQPGGHRSITSDSGKALHLTLDALTQVSSPRAAQQLFEGLLEKWSSATSRATAEHETPAEVADLMARCVDSRGLVGDLACGVGNALLAANTAGASGLRGTDVNASAAARTFMRLDLARVGDFRIAVANGLQLGARDLDAVVLHPPFGVRLTPEQQHGLYGLPLGPPSGGASDAAWLQVALSHLAIGGRAAVLTPVGTLFRGGYDLRVREGLLAANSVEAVILLPDALLTATKIPSCIWLLRARLQDPDPKVLFVDAAPLAQRHKGRTRLLPEALERVANIVRTFRDTGSCNEEPYLARAARVADLFQDDAALSPRRHLQPAPKTVAARPKPPQRLLSELRVENFKSFGSPEQRIPLGPITLIYGPNSAGKSSLMQSLLLLKQSLPSSTLVTQGKWADAGSFTGALHRHEASRIMSLGVTFGILDDWHLGAELPDPGLLRSVDLFFQGNGLGQPQRSEIRYRIGPCDLTFERDATESGEERLNATSEDLDRVFEAIASGAFLYPFKDDPNSGEERPVQGGRHQRAQQVAAAGRLARQLRKLNLDPLGFAADGILVGIPDLSILEQHAEDGRGTATLRRNLRQTGGALQAINSELSRLLRDLRYLGPLREAPGRFHNRSSAGDSENDGSGLAMYLFDNSSEVERVNAWLARMGIPYTLRIVPVNALGAEHAVGDLVAIVLTDARSGIDVSPADVGFGVSQVLPIVVQALANESAVVCVEQPEIHLHPALQAEFADLLVESTHPEGRANQFLVETHSEHLLLRLQRRIREGVLDADRLKVLYVDQPEGAPSARCSELRLDSRGEFIDTWPQGFFEERLEEIFGESP